MDIDNLLRDKKLKTKFNLEFYNIDAFIYLNIVIKSTYYISYDCINNDNYISNGMLHRNIVFSNISDNGKVFKILNVRADIIKNTIKIIMCLAKSISQKKIIIRVKGRLKCNFYVKLNLITSLDYASRLYINFSQIEMKNFNNYFIGASYLTLSSFIKKANFQLLKNNINCDAIIKLSKQPIYIDFTKWDMIKKNLIKRIKQEYNLNITEDATISDVINEISDQRNDHITAIDNFKFKKRLSGAALDVKYDKIVTDETKIISDDTITEVLSKFKIDLNKEDLGVKESGLNSEKILTEDNDLLDEDLKQIELSTKNLSKEIQKLYYILAAEKSKLLEYPIFIPYYYDFRGRIYPKSIIGFTYLKIFRALFKLPGFNKDVDLISLTSSTYFKIISHLKVAVDARFIKSELSEINKYFLIVHLSELGKCNKGKLANSNGLTLQDLIDNGTVLFFNKKNIDIDVDDLVYIEIISDNIYYFLDNNRFKNITIIRDSTASFLQHWSIKLTARDEYLNKLNLNGDIWYDTYTFIIDTFLKENPEYVENINFKEILKRKILKNFIMITNYNAGLFKCHMNLKEMLIESKIPFDDDKLNSFSKKFHLFLKDSLFDILFVNSRDNFIKKTGSLICTDDGSNINLTYLNYKENKDDIKIYEYRWVITRRSLIDIPCEWKTQIALNANIIQASDAELARFLINRLNIQSVHDSFAINLFELHKIIDLTNLFFNEKLKSNNYSIFILI